MHIKRLRIAGFKSFVDPADLRIEPGLTGVVGPNGCGKSNLLEALRWTMGETSAKSMRGAGMEDVIFAGTATRPPRDFAEVSILAEIGGNETEIVRRIERGAGSAYRIDGRDVRAKDVGLIFADAATGAHSPALVSQGRIGAVIAARPADRRAMLEEAAGITGLHVRRRDAEARLRATETNLARLDEIIADQDGRAASLRRQARAAERYRQLSDQIRRAEARMIFARWRDAATAAEQAKAEGDAAEARVAEAAEAERVAGACRHDAAATLSAARSAALAARERTADTAHRMQTLLAEKAEVTRRLAELADAARRIAEDRQREGTLAHDAADALARLAEEIRALDATIAQHVGAAPAIDARLVEAERHARDAEVALAQALSRQASEAAEARVANAALAAAASRVDRAARDVANQQAALAALAQEEPLVAEREAAAGRRAQATVALEEAGAAFAAADADEQGAIGDRAAADSRRATARADLAAIDGELAALTRATQRQDRDRLLDHLSVAPGYERALAAALGDNLETGLDAWTGAEIAPCDPGAPLDSAPLSDHVVAPPALARRLAQVFVVHEDADTWLAVGQRAVTLAGRLRRWDGFVATGTGAATAERLERRNRVAALQRERPQAVAGLADAESDHARIEAVIGAARAAAADARRALAAADTALRDATRAEDRAGAALERLADQRTDIVSRAHRLAQDHADALEERARAASDVTALPDGAAGVFMVASHQRAADERRTAVADARAERNTADRTLAAARERLAAANADTRSWKARAGDAARRIADMALREATLAREAHDMAGRPAALDAALSAADTDHAEARRSADTLVAAEASAEDALRSIEETHRRAADALGSAREGRAGALARLENQELRRVEMGRLSGERFQCPAALLPERLAFDAATVASPQEESNLHARLGVDRERIGPVNLVAESELAELEAAAHDNAAERAELGHAVARLRGSIGTLNREGRQRLLAAFEAVDGHFRRLFATLFGGGEAHLALIDSDDPLEAGLEIMAQPPGKRLQSLTLLSGGEQALTAVALIFALFLTNPAPICVLDEVDAPLDDANIERFCSLLDRMAAETDTRYLIVTHNAVTMSRMHRLFGVTMIEQGVSRLVSVDLQAAEGLLAAE